MKTYSVKEIADLLGTNPETVRRWIRNGKLQAVQESRKDGNLVTETDLNEFLEKTPKYVSIASKGISVGAAAIAPTVGIPLIIGGLMGTMFADKTNIEEKLRDDAPISTEDIIKYLNESINQHEDAIKIKRNTIAQLEQEVEAEEKKIFALRATLNAVNQHQVQD